MRAVESSNASGSGFNSGIHSGIYSGKFAALRHVTREMSLNRAAMPVVRRPFAAQVAGEAAVPIAGVADGAGLAHEAGNLLGALRLVSDLLAVPGVVHDEQRAYAKEALSVCAR